MADAPALKTWDVAVVGEIYADHVFSGFARWPAPGEEVLARHYTRELGGGAVNTACGLARLGRRVLLAGLIGAADRPWFERRLAQFGVGTDGLADHPAGTGVTASVSTREDRSFFTYHGANAHLPALLERPALRERLAAARHVHFAMPLARPLAASLLPALRGAGCTTSLDVGFSPDWLADPANRASCAEVDWFLPNRKEAALLCGDENANAFVAWMRTAGWHHGAVKLGAEGALAMDADGVHRVPPPAVEVADTTGAGDAFDAGFIDALLDGAAVVERLRRGCLCGALCASAHGALDGLPHPHDLQRIHELTYGT